MHRILASMFMLLFAAMMFGSASGQQASRHGNDSPTTRPTTQPARSEPLVVTERVAASVDDDSIYDPPVGENEKDRVIKLRVPAAIQAPILRRIDPIVHVLRGSPFDMTSYCLLGTKGGVVLSDMGVGGVTFEASGPLVSHPVNYSYTLTCHELVNRQARTGHVFAGRIEFASKKYGHYIITFDALVHLRPKAGWDSMEPVDAEITWHGPAIDETQ